MNRDEVVEELHVLIFLLFYPAHVLVACLLGCEPGSGSGRFTLVVLPGSDRRYVLKVESEESRTCS